MFQFLILLCLEVYFVAFKNNLLNCCRRQRLKFFTDVSDKSTKWLFSCLNHQNVQSFGLVPKLPKSPTHTGLICAETLNRNISSLTCIFRSAVRASSNNRSSKPQPASQQGDSRLAAGFTATRSVAERAAGSTLSHQVLHLVTRSVAERAAGSTVTTSVAERAAGSTATRSVVERAASSTVTSRAGQS